MEVGLDAQVTDRLNIGFSFSHMNAELTEVAPRLVRDLSTDGFGTDPVQYIDGQPGDRLPGSPEDQAMVYFGYDWTLSSRWDLTLNYGVSSVGDVITTTGLRGGGETLGGFSLHHASAVFSGGPWEFTIYAQNLLDKYAVTGRAVAACVPPDGSRRKRRPRPCAQLCATDGAAARDRLPLQLRFRAGAIRTAW